MNLIFYKQNSQKSILELFHGRTKRIPPQFEFMG